MKLKHTPLIASLILALSLPNIASAAVVSIPDLSGGGTFTIGAGDSSTDAVYIASTTDAVATLTVNGTWTVVGGGGETQLGGLYADDSGQNATLNIGTTGVVTVGALWVAGGWSSAGAPGSTPGTATINILQGGQLVLDGTNFGVRATYNLPSAYPLGFTVDGTTDGASGTTNALGVYTMLWNQGVLQKDGANTGTFAENFSYSGGASAGTLTAIPEPSTALLGGLGMLCLLRRRRA